MTDKAPEQQPTDEICPTCWSGVGAGTRALGSHCPDPFHLASSLSERPDRASGARGIPEYPSRTFQHADGRRTVPWEDWQELRRIAVAVQDAQVARMVDRFLSWRLPETFAPDHYITFDREAAKGLRDRTNGVSWPVGTNLLTADEARQMFEYVLATAPAVGHDASSEPRQNETNAVAVREALAELVSENKRLRTVEHLAWHLLESSEEHAQTGVITVDRDDFDALAAVLPDSMRQSN